MANFHDVKRGNTLWGIASANKSAIAGSTINAKIDTLVKVNNIQNRNLIYVGQRIWFSEAAKNGSSGSGSKSTTTQPSYTINKATITNIGLHASDEDKTGRTVIAKWIHSNPMDTSPPNHNPTRNKYVDHYVCHWEELIEQFGEKIWANSTTEETESYQPNDDWNNKQYKTYKASAEALKVRLKVLPVSGKKENVKEGEEELYWPKKYNQSEWAVYDFSKNPPLPFDKEPTVKLDPLDDTKLIISYDTINIEEFDATYVQFNVVKNNTASVYTSSNVPFMKVDGTDNVYTVSHSFNVEYGNEYKVRARAVNFNGQSAWTDFTSPVYTKPCAPKSITVCRCKTMSDNSIGAYLEWEPVPNATKYVVEYTTLRENFDMDKPDGNVTTTDARTSCDIIGLATGKNYYFRVRAYNATSDDPSDPTKAVQLQIGTRPTAPTTWSSSNSAFVGDRMELNWTHNSPDGSAQTYAEIALKINENDWWTYITKNTTTENDEDSKTDAFTYGEAISYKGEVHVVLNTSHADLKDSTIIWKVRTVGINGIDEEYETSDFSPWSADRTINIYAKPTLELSVTSDLAGDVPFEDVTIPAENEGEEGTVIRKALTTFPFYIRAEITGLNSYEKQRPIGYHLRVVANDYYETTDNAGRTKVINPGDAVYSKYFDTTETLIVEMSANNIDLEPLISYTVYCNVDMSTGMSVNGSDEFNVFWSDVEYTLDAEIWIDNDTYTAVIRPKCVDAEGEPIENVTMSVYRREYDGALIEIATNIPNDGMVVTDPHPALDYARYRLIAKDTQTGAISFYDMPGHHIGCTSVIIQWDEEWSQFESMSNYYTEGPSLSGSMLVLPYNVKVSDKRKREVSRVNYAGREYPVSYHGIAINESSSWNTVIPKSDTETIYALRRLSLWAGKVYVREPSGMGFWANIEPSFNLDFSTTTVPVTLSVTRVEGGA